MTHAFIRLHIYATEMFFLFPHWTVVLVIVCLVRVIFTRPVWNSFPFCVMNSGPVLVVTSPNEIHPILHLLAMFSHHPTVRVIPHSVLSTHALVFFLSGCCVISNGWTSSYSFKLQYLLTIYFWKWRMWVRIEWVVVVSSFFFLC